jgi:hypothetical protein
VKSLLFADKLSASFVAEPDSCVRIQANLADGTGVTLRPTEVAVIRWREGRTELLIERRDDTIAVNASAGRVLPLDEGS